MRLVFSDRGWEDYLYWQSTDRQMLKRINDLIKDIRRNAHQGIGKPEPLRHTAAGFWSRRINDEHRLVYRVETDAILIAQARFHYSA